MIWLNKNAENRTPLDDNIGTLKIFKRVFPTFTVWKERLKIYGIDDSLFIEEDYKFLTILIGNSFLKYSTSNKNAGYAAMNLQILKADQKRQEAIYNLNLDKFFKVEDEILNIIDDKFTGNSLGNVESVSYNLGNVKEGNQTDILPDFVDEKDKSSNKNITNNSRTANNKNNRNTKLSLAKNLMALDYFVNLKYPKLTFIVKMASVLKHPYQPTAIKSENI